MIAWQNSALGQPALKEETSAVVDAFHELGLHSMGEVTAPDRWPGDEGEGGVPGLSLETVATWGLLGLAAVLMVSRR